MTIKNFLIPLIAIPILDFIWLGLIANDFYKQRLGELINIEDGKMQIVYWSAGVVYILLALAIAFFAEPMIENVDHWWVAALNSAFLGFIIYGVYDFTNHATLKTWPLDLIAADVAWGAFICGVSGTLVYFFGSKA